MYFGSLLYPSKTSISKKNSFIDYKFNKSFGGIDKHNGNEQSKKINAIPKKVVRNGLGIFYYENGECYDGEFKNDLPDGKGNWYYPGYPNEKHIKYSGYFKEGEYIGNQKYDEDYNCLIF